jgi:outer membrane protein assembly factor BamB
LYEQQKLVVGDDSGTVHCYEFKRGEPQVVFETKVFNAPVSCLALGGPAMKRDKVISRSFR